MAKTFKLEDVPARLTKFSVEEGEEIAIAIVLDVDDEPKFRKALDQWFPGATMTAKAIAADESAGADITMRGKLHDVTFKVRDPAGKPVTAMTGARAKGKPNLAIGAKAQTMKIETTIVGRTERDLLLRVIDAVRGAADVFVTITASQMEIDDAIDDGGDDKTPDIFARENAKGGKSGGAQA